MMACMHGMRGKRNVWTIVQMLMVVMRNGASLFPMVGRFLQLYPAYSRKHIGEIVLIAMRMNIV